MGDPLTEPVIYLNNAATTWPKPPGVLSAATGVFSSPFHEHGRTSVQDAPDYVETGRETVAEFFGVPDPQEIIFTSSATDSLNILIHGFALHHAGPFHAITTDLEHNSVLRPLRSLERQGKCTLTIVGGNGPTVDPGAVADAMREDTALVVVGHGSNVTGSVQEIGQIGKMARDAGAFFIVDGAQTAGQYPVDLRGRCIDAFVFTGHKSLFGLPGTGGFFLQTPRLVDPIRQGGTGVDSSSRFQPDEMPLKYETGTHNYPGIAALNAGVEYVKGKGVENIRRESDVMISYLSRALGEIEGIHLYNPSPEIPVLTFFIEGMESDDIGFILWKAYRIVVRTGLHCAPLVHERIHAEGGVRLSLSCMNTMAECEAAVSAIEEIARYHSIA